MSRSNKNTSVNNNNNNRSRNNVHKRTPCCPHCTNINRASNQKLPTNHFLRETEEPTSRVVCPVLLQTECRFCSSLGHTVSACPALAAKKLKAKDSLAKQEKLSEEKIIKLQETSHSATSRSVEQKLQVPSQWSSHKILSLLSSTPSTNSKTIQNPIQNPIVCYSLDQAKVAFSQEATPTLAHTPSLAEAKETMIRAEFALAQAQSALARVEYALAEEDSFPCGSHDVKDSKSVQVQAPIKWIGRSVTSWADDSSDEEEDEDEEEEEDEDEEEEVKVEVEEGVEFAVLLYKRLHEYIQ